MYNDKYIAVLIPAAGVGKRMASDQPKQFLELLGQPILHYTIQAILDTQIPDVLVVIGRAEDEILMDQIVAPLMKKFNQSGSTCKYRFVVGGKERQESVYNGLVALSDTTFSEMPVDYVMVHDGARPFVTKEVIIENLNEAFRSGAAIAAVPVKDTIKVIEAKGRALNVLSTPERSTLYMIQTPQCFEKTILVEAHETARALNFIGTDDSMLVERLGRVVTVSHGNYSNIKMTTPEDLVMGEHWLRSVIK